jgi:hypothetical protein
MTIKERGGRGSSAPSFLLHVGHGMPAPPHLQAQAFPRLI